MGSTSHSSRGKDLGPVLDALREQGWRVEDTERGHVRAVPPDKTKPIVHFGHSRFPRSMRNAISELRVSGFVWPPQQKEEEMQPVKKSFQEQLRTVKEDPPSPPAVQVVPPKKTEELSVDQLLERWKAAKTNFAKALADVGATEDSVEEAQALLAAERNSLMSAETRLITLRKELDEALDQYGMGGR